MEVIPKLSKVGPPPPPRPTLNVGHFGLRGHVGQDILARDISATENAKVGIKAKTINCGWGRGWLMCDAFSIYIFLLDLKLYFRSIGQ